MVTRQPGPENDPQLQALTSLAGWRQFASEVPAVPELLDSATWQDLDPGKRAAYDDDRIAHHSRLLVVQTPRRRRSAETWWCGCLPTIRLRASHRPQPGCRCMR